jgi:hypothetical protein
MLEPPAVTVAAFDVPQLIIAMAAAEQITETRFNLIKSIPLVQRSGIQIEQKTG